ncbi:MAG: hypothetical protein A4E55_00124 [Pelotomaculum sp. PtaU1.Bin035]|nr:MAG: hypothetical protein A4E55_00124 [Pelotomaculum sp. PtaU1.Bin035]
MGNDTVGVVKAYFGTKQVKLQKDVQVNILRQVMDQEKRAGQDLLENTLPASKNPPHLGNNIDIYI